MRVLLILLVLAACGRPLTGPETDLAARLFGATLDPAPVRLYRNGFVGMFEHRYATRPRTTCRERILPPSTEPFESGRFAGGGLGNVVDRVVWGAVADFLNVSCCGMQNPWAFNIADVAVFVGAFGLILTAGRKKQA